MESRDDEAASLRADLAASQEELQQARTTLADTSAKDKAERLEAEVLEARSSLKEKESSINQACSASFISALCFLPVSYTHLTLPTNREV